MACVQNCPCSTPDYIKRIPTHFTHLQQATCCCAPALQQASRTQAVHLPSHRLGQGGVQEAFQLPAAPQLQVPLQLLAACQPAGHGAKAMAWHKHFCVCQPISSQRTSQWRGRWLSCQRASPHHYAMLLLMLCKGPHMQLGVWAVKLGQSQLRTPTNWLTTLMWRNWRRSYV